MPRIKILQAILLGLLSAFFLSAGLIINSLNAFHGGNWAWTACLRYLLMLPVLFMIVGLRRKLRPLFVIIGKIPATFLIWGNLGFGCYYALLSYAMTLAPGWLVTAGFMTTVLAGILIAPFLYRDHRGIISKKAFILSSFIVIGLTMTQFERLSHLHGVSLAGISLGLSLIAAFLWPLGNRKLMLKLEKECIAIDPIQRILGMTIGSLPVLMILAISGYCSAGIPTSLQVKSSFVAVLFSGILGSILFYKATQMVSRNQLALLAVEATQVTGVVFTLLGEILFRGIKWPGFYGNLGFGIMAVSLIGYTYLSMKRRPVLT